MFNNRKMSGILGMGTVSTRRYCFQFLGADAAAGLHGGVARTLSRRDAFRVFLGVNLIQEGRFTLEESKRLVAILGPVIEKKKLLPEVGAKPDPKPAEVFIYKADNEAGFYLEWEPIGSQKREGINIDPRTGAFPIYVDHFCVTFNLTRLVEIFLKREGAGMGQAGR